MLKKLLLVLFACVLLPSALSAYRFGFGIHADVVSGGLEFRTYVPLGVKSSWFVAPHAIGGLVNQQDGILYGYSLGLRTGFMFNQDKWISPYLAAGAGHTGSSGDVGQIGGRLSVGVALLPFRSNPWRDDEDAEGKKPFFEGLLLEIDTGLLYLAMLDAGPEDPSASMLVPDIGIGINISW